LDYTTRQLFETINRVWEFSRNEKDFFSPPSINKNKIRQQKGRRPGLPDGVFSNQKSQFGYTLEGLELEKVGIFYGHLEL
jgi:hypothetical protein